MTDGMGFWVKLHGNNFEAPMSALGHKRTLKRLHTMSALPQKRTSVEPVVMSALCQKQTFRTAERNVVIFHRRPARQGKPAVERGPTPNRRPENQRFLQPEITKGLGRSRADRGLKFGECKGATFALSCNLNAFYEAFMTAIIAFA